MTYKALAAALVVSIVTSPAFANGTADQKSAKGQASVGERKYCLKGDITGTRIAREQCRTKKEWAEEGVQIDEKKSN
jgi:hypothetical protein